MNHDIRCLVRVTEPTGNGQATTAMATTESVLTTTMNQQQTSTIDSHTSTVSDEGTTVTGLQPPTGIS